MEIMMEGGANVTEAELNELRQKFQLLEGDRRAYYELSMKQMKENKNTIAELRQRNKDFRKQLKDARKRNATSSVQASEQVEVDKIEKHVGQIRRNLDTIKAKVEEKRNELEKLRDKASELGLDFTSSERPGLHTTPETAKKIRSLENRLDRSIIKLNEAQSIKKTYEQIIERLKEERDGFDSQLAAIERTIKVKDRDVKELENLQSDALQAKDFVMRDYQAAIDNVDRRRKEREKELERKRRQFESTRTLRESVEEMGKNRIEIISKVSGDLSKAEEEHLRKVSVMNIISAKSAKLPHQDMEKLDEYEVAFAKIMKIAGVNDINDITKKILSQGDTHKGLEELIEENNKRIEDKQEELARKKEDLEELRFTGMSRTGGLTRKKIDELEDSLVAVRTTLSHKKAKFENVSSTLLSAQTGIRHLLDKIKVLRPTEVKQMYVSPDSLYDALKLCEDALESAFSRAKAELPSSATKSSSKAWQDAVDVQSDEVDLLAVMPYNQRVKLVDQGQAPPLRLKDGSKDYKEENQDEEESKDADNENAGMFSDGDSEDEYANDPANPVSRAHIKQVSRIIVRQRSPRNSISTGLDSPKSTASTPKNIKATKSFRNRKPLAKTPSKKRNK